jgi:tRNA(Ile)-lysidine synthase
MIEPLAQILKENCRLDPARPVLVGVSGGPDSLCLLHVLWQLGYPLVVAHYNHGLRPEAEADAAAVGLAAAGLGLSFVTERGDVRAAAETNRLSIEEAARQKRYQFLFEQARQVSAQAVAVGHTADDQVETVLMHLLRGAGLSGLGGMRYRARLAIWSEEIPLVRPLLGVWREEVERYITEQGLAPVLDESNLDPSFYRNRLRRQLLPYLQAYNPRVKELLWQTASLLQEDEAVLEVAVEAAWMDCLLEKGEGALALAFTPLLGLPTGLQRRVLRRALSCLRPGLRDISYDTVRRALSFLSSPAAGGQIDLADGLRLWREGERVWIAGWSADLPTGGWPAVPDQESRELTAPGRLRLGDGWVLEASILAAVPEPGEAPWRRSEAPDPFSAWLDLDRLALPLQVRARRPGDRFRPLGLGGHSLKLSDYFINAKLPQRARLAWPLVLSAGEIAWLPGFAPGEAFRFTPDTRRVLHLRLSQEAAADRPV